MKEKQVNMHKRLAMGDTVKGYAQGGRIASSIPAVDVKPSGRATNPLRAVKATNGIPGFKKGGKC